MAANALFAVKGAIQNALGEIGQGGPYFALSSRVRLARPLLKHACRRAGNSGRDPAELCGDGEPVLLLRAAWCGLEDLHAKKLAGAWFLLFRC